MENFAFYLLKSTVWISGFALVYILFLQNERYFVLNRIFLVLGILSAILLPFFTVHYSVENTGQGMQPISDSVFSENMVKTSSDSFISHKNILLILYIAGAAFVLTRALLPTISVLQIIRKSEKSRCGNLYLIRSARYQTSFSFISYMFVNPSTDKTELREIIRHEREHIRQKHWIDLLLFEVLRTVLWFNPLVWFYGRLIRQNHEYMADKHALANNQNPGNYRAALLNQTLGSTVIPLANSFNYSFNKKRFNMMKNIKHSPFRKLKLLVIIPVIAGILYAFSTPEYVSGSDNLATNETAQTANVVVGNITWEGNSVHSAKKLNKVSGIKSGKSYSEKELEKQLYGPVSDLYLNDGYLFFNVEKKESAGQNGTTDLKLKIHEGRQVRIGTVQISGAEATKEDLKAIKMKNGDLFSKDKLNESYKALAKTGGFIPDSINPHLSPNVELGTVDIVFYVVEK